MNVWELYLSAVASRFVCSDEVEADMSGQGQASQVTTGMIALGIVHGSSNSQEVLGDANVRMDAVFC